MATFTQFEKKKGLSVKYSFSLLKLECTTRQVLLGVFTRMEESSAVIGYWVSGSLRAGLLP